MAPFLQKLHIAAQGILQLSSIWEYPVPNQLAVESMVRHPVINATLIPQFDVLNVTGLDVRMVIESPDIKANDAFLWLTLQIGKVPTQRYVEDDIGAFDEHGPLILSSNDKGGQRHFVVARDTAGDVTLQFHASPRHVDPKTPMGPRIDMRTDVHGLLSAGNSFMPIPLDKESMPQTYLMGVEWDLSASPDGTQAYWTFGEGPKLVQHIGHADILTESLYAVGRVKGVDDGVYGYHFFGEPPKKIERLGTICQDLFQKMSVFFQDPPSETNPYRIFVRNSSPARGYGGGAYKRSYILEYDENVADITEDDIFLLLAHEIVHNWPLMQVREPLDDGTDSSADWYSEGIADYYAAILPYRFGLISQEQYMKKVNEQLTAYYTNPLVNISQEEAAKRAWDTTHAQRIPYSRGCIYLYKVDAEIRKASSGARSLDDVVQELLRRSKSDEPYDLTVWFHLITQELGPQAVDDYKSIFSGNRAIPAADALGPDYELVRVDQEILELGMSEASLSQRVVSGLKKGSRAEESGLHDGDEILKMPFFSVVSDHLEINLELTVKRALDDKTEILQISYWPRSWEKAESYQFIKRDTPSELR